MGDFNAILTDVIQNPEKYSQQMPNQQTKTSAKPTDNRRVITHVDTPVATTPPKPTPPITINNGQAKAPAPVAHKSSSGGGTSISSLYESDMNEQAHELKNFIFDIINKGKLTPEDVKKESADMESRMQLHYLSMVSSKILAKAGIQGAAQMAAEAEKEYMTLSYINSEARNNPIRYIQYKIADIAAKLAPFIQSYAPTLSAFQKGKAQAASAYAQMIAANNQPTAIQGGGGSSGYDGISNAEAKVLLAFRNDPALFNNFAKQLGIPTEETSGYVPQTGGGK